MTNLEASPTEVVCASDNAEHALATDGPPRPARADDATTRGVVGPQVLIPRVVPLGGLRAMTVRRTLPQHERSLIGAWCFADHYGPDDVAATGGMAVAPHPHTGLQTVSWLFSGEIEHRDSLGTHALVHPGELNLMTAGRGIAHSEVSTSIATVLHGVQLWTALPAAHLDAAPAFDHYVPPVTVLAGQPAGAPGAALVPAELRVFLGSLAGTSSPVRSFSPLLGAELVLPRGGTVDLHLDPTFEHGYLVDAGPVRVDGAEVQPGELAYLPTGRMTVRIAAIAEDDGGPARLLVLGGEPLGERVVMWWNFLGRSHGDVVEARAAWQAEITGTPARQAAARQATARHAAARFGEVAGGVAPLPAPALPGVKLLPRG